MKKGRNSPALLQLADHDRRNEKSALTNPLLEEGLNESPDQHISVQPSSFPLYANSPRKTTETDNNPEREREKEKEKNPTHIIINPFNTAKTPAFASQKLLTQYCIPTTVETPNTGITTAVTTTPNTNSDRG